MDSPLISVIIPVYNIEKYLPQCLDSVCQQTYQNLEIICINDGSTDNSPSILRNFQEKDTRIILINQENKGLSAARNTGLKYVTSEYVAFVDSDDYVDPRYIEILYHKLCEKNADFSVCDTLPIGNNIQENMRYKYWVKKKMKYFPEAPINPNKFIPNVWNKLFKMDIVKKYKLQFPEGLLMEDNYWHFLYCAFSKKYAVAYENLYFHRKDNPDSIMTKTLFEQERNYDVIKICCRIFDSLFNIDNFKIYQDYLDDFFFFQLNYLIRTFKKTYIDKDFWNEIKEYLVRSETARKRIINTKYFDMLDNKIFGIEQKAPSKVAIRHPIKGKKSINFRTFLRKCLVSIFNKLAVKKNRILFWNMNGKGFGDNPKYIALEMIKRKNFELIWLYDKNNLFYPKEFPKEIKLVERNSLKALYYLSTYHVFISNCRQNLLHKDGLKKRKEQIYIHTWHGSFAFKKIEKDYPKLSKEYIEKAVLDSKDIDYLSSGSKWSENTIFKDVFWYSGKYFRGGNPRNDILFNSNNGIKEKVYQYFNLSQRNRILMYAPTFRDNKNIDIYQSLDYLKLKEALEDKFPGEWVILSRLHPHLIKEKNILPKYDWLRDATKYPDMQELLCVTDILITDYSSSIFDFLITGRLGLIYAPDKEYYEEERGFYIYPEDTPFPVAYDNVQLQKNIREIDLKQYHDSAQRFLTDLGTYDRGNASSELVDLILNRE